MHPKRIAIVTAIVALVPMIAAGEGCPLRPADQASLSGPLTGRSVLVGSAPPSVLFRSGLERDDDGAPTTYHRGLTDDRPDPGLDHICVGGSVLEPRDGRLFDRYGADGSIGSLSGVDPSTGIGRSRLCKRDYIKLRDAGFPTCDPQQPCMIWYGILSEARPAASRAASVVRTMPDAGHRFVSGRRMAARLTST